MKNKILLGLFLVGLALSGTSEANWNADWANREKVFLNTASDGVPIKAEVDGAQVLIRLHTGNFDFNSAKSDGSDLRFIDADDKTPLKFHIESFDSVTEVALVWVTVPKLAPGNKTGFIWLYYNNPKAPPASDPKSTYDAAQTVVMHFNQKGALPQDSTPYGNNASESSAAADDEALIGSGLTFSGQAQVVIPTATSLKTGTDGFTVSMWIKPGSANQNAVLFRQVEGRNSITLSLRGDKLVGQINSASSIPAGNVTAAWHHVALVGKDNLAIYLDGQQVGQLAVAVPAISGSVAIGQGFVGELDEFHLASTARSADWIQVEALGQGVDQKLITYGTAEGGEDTGSPSYFKILLGSVTIDGWVVIGILMVMMLISFTVMTGKAVFISRISRANAKFQEGFATLGSDLVALENDPTGAAISSARKDASSMYRIYHVGTLELRKRFASYREKGRDLVLSSQSIDAIRASLDASLIRELQRMNSQMVLLTIAIAGGPFLGLLGTVVGVMITFAAIAAAGDVNVNAIAPGIAAALVATVAGLAVAIPSLFGYNYLASRIKELSTDMQVFVDEFVTKVAENYSE